MKKVTGRAAFTNLEIYKIEEPLKYPPLSIHSDRVETKSYISQKVNTWVNSTPYPYERV